MNTVADQVLNHNHKGHDGEFIIYVSGNVPAANHTDQHPKPAAQLAHIGNPTIAGSHPGGQALKQSTNAQVRIRQNHSPTGK